MAAEKEMACCVRSYHVYKDIWAAVIGKCWCVARSQATGTLALDQRIDGTYMSKVYTIVEVCSIRFLHLPPRQYDVGKQQ